MQAQITPTMVEPVIPAARKAGPSRLRRYLKNTLLGLTFLITLSFIANWLWTMSGSNQWELKIDEGGTQVYTLKAPGATMLKIRAVMQTKEFTLSNHLAPLLDTSIQEDCAKWVPSCLSYKILQQWDPKTQSNVTMWTLGMPGPFSPREILLQGQLTQDPTTKVLTLENIAVPNKIAPNDCCVRLSHVHNVWRYTPIGDGNIKVEFVNDMDMSGAFPKFLLNLGAPGEIHKMLTVDNPKLLRQEKYRNARLDFIDEGLAK
ncbi:hypothetical protein [Massilia scottii]|uniref:hypothetical protein n=1 Tax=Massilia scottii TaxID=3057166 RepID=UPI002796B872|nr:hypothetical protein [Massilia sp. CCM 9029]MDQ1829155.1 hypothetical protein [Massilia sp. CCM 9029]